MRGPNDASPCYAFPFTLFQFFGVFDLPHPPRNQRNTETSANLQAEKRFLDEVAQRQNKSFRKIQNYDYDGVFEETA